MTRYKGYWIVGGAAGVLLLVHVMSVLFTEDDDYPIDKTKLIAYSYKQRSAGSTLTYKSPVYIPPDMVPKLERIGNASVKDPSSVNVKQAVFVTASDYSHFKESRDSVASIQKHYPNYKIIYYDMGLWWRSYERQVKSWCGVEYRQLNFNMYPRHVRKLGTYAWKPLIIQEVLQTYNTIIWFDASVRVTCTNMLEQLEPLLKTNGIALVDVTGHSSFAATDTRMYNYLPDNQTILKTTNMLGASFIALTNTKALYDNVLSSWIRCALWRDCMAPKGSTNICSFPSEERFKEYASCHRYDQSALNLLLLDYFKGNETMYHARETCVLVERSVTHLYELQYCEKS